MIDPYQLLGMTIESTLADASAAFRSIALIVHPDKGGRAADMKVLLDAYRYVTAQLTAVNHTETVESLEAEFAAFCAAQKDDDDLRPPWVRDLLRSSDSADDPALFDTDRFNDEFRQRRVNDVFDDRPSDAPLLDAMWREDLVGPKGYGDLMTPSEYACPDVDVRVAPIAYAPLLVVGLPGNKAASHAVAPPFRREVAVYAEPMSGDSWFGNRFGSGGVGGRGPKLGASDYVDAFNTTPEPRPAPPTLTDEPLVSRLERLLAERERENVLFTTSHDASAFFGFPPTRTSAAAAAATN